MMNQLFLNFPILAAAGTDTPTDSAVLLQIGIILLIVILKGFFVAAEFALVKVRASQLDELIEEKNAAKGAMRTKGIVQRIGRYVAATQIGITVMGIVSSMFGERYIVAWLHPKLEGIMPSWASHTLAMTISVVLVVGFLMFIDVVFGELLPKSVAIRRPLGTALKLSGPLTVFEILCRPVTLLLNWTADGLLKYIFRINTGDEGQQNVHSAEELQILVEESQRSKHVTATERDISIKALELNDLVARDVMTPRTEIVALDPKEDFRTNLKIAMESKHTRFPLRERNLDNCLGIIHMKDLLRIIHDAKPDITRIRRDIVIVPESQPLDELLKLFLARRAHMALVVDEFGATTGMVTLEDVLEELVGEIEDEFDSPEEQVSGFRKISDDEFIVDGKLPLYSLAELSDVELESEEVSTIGGYVTSELGHLPSPGESLRIDGYEVTVTKSDNRRVVELHFERKALTPEQQEAEDNDA